MKFLVPLNFSDDKNLAPGPAAFQESQRSKVQWQSSAIGFRGVVLHGHAPCSLNTLRGTSSFPLGTAFLHVCKGQNCGSLGKAF